MIHPKKAMVLAAGLGKRMRPITDTIPKPMVRVAGKTLIDYGLDSLAQAGVEQAVINVHYLADILEAHLQNRHDLAISISNERAELLDSAGGIINALPMLGDAPFYILNADTFWVDQQGEPANLYQMAEAFDETRMDILLMVARLDQATGYDGKGDFTLTPDNQLLRRQHDDPQSVIYAGAAIIHPRIFKDAETGISSLNRYFDHAIATKRLYAMPMHGHWLTVGTPDAIEDAEKALEALK
ncbi:nucleotidyltransferase family protein [Paenochrobactrum sp. BZR 588]|uniref:nucleotidyltransferase family protein n=1 Tax=Paenochrobactrum TaxID=999488 RepID=UPI0035BBDC6B